jgi:hypothetical protein
MRIILLLLALSVNTAALCQRAEQKFIIITADGLRWQEVFKGMNSLIASDKKFNQGDSLGLFKKYWSVDPVKRRSLLMPFFWTTIQSAGQLYGNRQKMEPYMLVVGAKGSSNIRNLHLGSNTVHMFEKAACPVLVVPIMND